jgi:hypothetical protein
MGLGGMEGRKLYCVSLPTPIAMLLLIECELLSVTSRVEWGKFFFHCGRERKPKESRWSRIGLRIHSTAFGSGLYLYLYCRRWKWLICVDDGREREAIGLRRQSTFCLVKAMGMGWGWG